MSWTALLHLIADELGPEAAARIAERARRETGKTQKDIALREYAAKVYEAIPRGIDHRLTRVRAESASVSTGPPMVASRPPGPHGGPIEGLRRPAAPGWIAPATRERLDAALLAVARDQALAELVDLLDPDGTRTPWDLAGEILRRLARFEAAAWPRIRSGARPANGRLEGLLAAILSDPTTPRSQKRLRPLLPP